MGTIDGLISTAVGLYSDIQNREMQRENQEYIRGQNDLTRMREDTAVQRRAKDLEAAGINPILAAGQAASSSAPIATGAPQMGFQNTKMALDAAMAMTRQKQDIATSAAEEARIKEEAQKTKDVNLMNQKLKGMFAEDGKSAWDKMAEWQYDNAMQENIQANKASETMASAAEKAAVDAANSKRDLQFRIDNKVYGQNAADYAAMTQYINGIDAPGDLKGMLFELGNKLIGRIR